MSYSEEDDSDNNTEGPLVEDEEDEVSDQQSNDNDTLSNRDEDSASELESPFSDSPWDLEPELQVHLFPLALGLSTVTVYGYGHLVDGMYMVQSRTIRLPYVEDCSASTGRDGTVYGRHTVTHGSYGRDI